MLRRSFLGAASTMIVVGAARGALAAEAPGGYSHATAPTMFVDVGEVRIAYRRFGNTGDGVPLVLFMHFLGNMDNWDSAVTDGLAREREVILFDNVGIGGSTGAIPTSIDQMARDAEAFIAAIGLTKVDLLGFSMGGLVAQQVALDRPDLVRRLLLVGTGPRSGEAMDRQNPQSQAVFSAKYEHPDDLWLAVFFTPSAASQAAGRAFQKRFRARTENRDVPIDPAKVAPPQIAAMEVWGAARPNPYEYLRLILKENIPNAHLIIYPDASHGSLLQYPDRFVQDVSVFFDGGY
jgi:pimeloyl-ACP methyl ester carboxylesterase